MKEVLALVPISLSNLFPIRNWLVVAKRDLDGKQNAIVTRGRKRGRESELLLMRYVFFNFLVSFEGPSN